MASLPFSELSTCGLCSDVIELLEPMRDRVDVFSLPLYGEHKGNNRRN